MRIAVMIVMLGLAGGMLAPRASAEEQRVDRPADWASEQFARLDAEFDTLKRGLAELGERAAPALDRAREGIAAARDKFEAERPRLEAAGAELWDQVKAAAATLAADLSETFAALEEKLASGR